MARYKYIDTQPKFLPVDLAQQLHPGTFEHALNYRSTARSISRRSMRAFEMMRPGLQRIRPPCS